MLFIYPRSLGQCLKDVIKFWTLGNHNVANLSITFWTFHPSSTKAFLLSFRRCSNKKVLLVANILETLHLEFIWTPHSPYPWYEQLFFNIFLLQWDGHVSLGELLLMSMFAICYNIIHSSWACLNIGGTTQWRQTIEEHWT
jgi:hypothetical protein